MITLSTPQRSRLRISVARWISASATLCLLATPLVEADPVKQASQLAPEDRHARTAKQIYKMVSREHYLDMEADDALSERMFDSYLETLDSNRMYLLDSDLREFDRYRHILDDSIRTGDLDAPYAIFNRYQKRFLERVDWALDQVFETLKAGFDAHESVRVDREGVDWPKETKEANKLWRQHVKLQLLNLRLAGKSDKDSVELLEKRYVNQKRRMMQTNSEDVFRIFTNAWTRIYDPHTSYFSEHNSKNFQINMSLSLEGIGAVLEQDDEYIKIVRLIHAGPADKQGDLKPADRIVGVGQGADGKVLDVIGWRLDEVVDRIRGPRGTVVRLEVLPADGLKDGKSKLISISRDTVKLEEQAATKDVLELDTQGDGEPHRFGVIDLPTFYTDFAAMQRGDRGYRSTTRDARKLLSELVEEDVDGVIIDLRGNGGGSLTEANDLIGLFIRSGPTVQIRRKNNRLIRHGKRRGTSYYDGPLAVLIDRLSASASEIFAGAIQDYRRGLVMGSVSFGKGTVQTLMKIHSGQMKVTEAKFYRISGDSTQHRGIIPNFMFPAMYDSREIGESALEYALPWDEIPKVRFQRYHDFDTHLPALLSLHQQRARSTPGLVYLKKRLDLERARADVEFISLNEESRRQQQERREREGRALESEWRVASGLKPLPEPAAEDEGDARQEAQDTADETASADSDAKPSVAKDAKPSVAKDAKPEGPDASQALASSDKEGQEDGDSTEPSDDKKPEDDDHVLLEVAHILQDAVPLFRTRTALR